MTEKINPIVNPIKRLNIKGSIIKDCVIIVTLKKLFSFDNRWCK